MIKNREKTLDILLVEDEKITQKVIESLLISQGWNVRVVSDGLKAVEILQLKSFHMALIDIHIPKIDGLELIKMIRGSMNSAKEMKIILMTAGDILKYKEKSLEIEVDEYIQKPVEKNKLIDKVEKLMGLNHINSIINIESTLMYLDDDIELLKEIMQDFISDEYIQTIFNDMKKAIENNDYKLLYKRAHKLKGAAATLNIYKMHQIAATLENQGRKENSNNIMNLFDQLKKEYLIVEKVFKEYINNHNK